MIFRPYILPEGITGVAKLFICHSWEDNDLAYWLAEKLKQAKVDIWIDYQCLKYGYNLPKHISDALEWCDTLILLWSTHASISRWIQMEWTSAISMGRLIIPCLIDTKPLPAILTPNLNISFKDRNDGFRKLCDTFKVAFSKSKFEQVEQVGEVEKDIPIEFEYIGAIKWKEGDYADETHLYLKLGINGKYSFFSDGCGPYGYKSWVRFGSIRSNRLFTGFLYKRISEMPLEFSLSGREFCPLPGDEEFLSWEQVKDIRVNNLYFDMFAKKGNNYQEVIYELAKMIKTSQNVI